MSLNIVEKVNVKVLEVIQRHRSDVTFANLNDAVSQIRIMYSYGSTSDFREMISELEDTFEMNLDIDDIGELTVQSFIALVIDKIQKAGLKNVTDVIRKGYNAIIQNGETFNIVGGIKKVLYLTLDNTGETTSINIDDVERFTNIEKL